MMTTIPTPSELEAALLEARGLGASASDEERNNFLYPKYSIGDVFEFFDMEKAVDRIYRAVRDGEVIGVYADYDCDGIPGAVILHDFFEKVGVTEKLEVYIPDRHDEGYGLSPLGIGCLAEKNAKLIITVDLGITGIAEVADANARGIDVIVTDHHAPLGTAASELPAALALVHPCKSSYQNSEPCGAGVVFYLVCGFLKKYGAEFGIPEGWEKWLLDLVGFATLADMVPIGGSGKNGQADGAENRMLATYGLSVMRKTRRVGLRTLFAAQNIYLPTLTEQDLTFTVAPRLNAASRMATPKLAYDLLCTKSEAEAMALVQKLEEINSERKTLVARIVKESHKVLVARDLPDIVVIGNPEWRPAVLGLVATKLSETYARSFFVWGNGGDGIIKGSCRVLDAHHAAHLMQALPAGMLLQFGGHQAAGGFAVAKEQIHFLEEELNKKLGEKDLEEGEAAEAALPPLETSTGSLPVPLAITTTRHLEIVRRFAPFGTGNPQPEFLFENVTIKSTKMFGKAKEHLECLFEDGTGSATGFMFFAPEKTCTTCVPGANISFTGTLEAGWRGGARVRIQKVL